MVLKRCFGTAPVDRIIAWKRWRRNMQHVFSIHLLCKDNANERKENLFSVSRVQLILCKGITKI